MSDFIFPDSDFDNPQKLLAMVGSLWQNTYQGSALIEDTLAARAQLDEQNHLNFLELLAAMSRLTVPIFHAENWSLLRFLESQRNQAVATLARYDGTFTYDVASGLAYGVPNPSLVSTWSLPDNLRGGKLLMNRITAASLTLVQGVDYVINRDTASSATIITFRTNIFDNDLVPRRNILQNNVVVDREAGLWLYRGEYDLNTVYEQFGYALGLRLQSSPLFRDLINAVYDALVFGTAQSSQRLAFSAMTDVPLVKNDGEIVEGIFDDADQRHVVTDKTVYTFHPEATVIVAIGDVVNTYDTLTDTLQFFEFNRGQIPDDIKALAIGKGFLAHGFFQDVVFENKIVPWVIETDPFGYTKMSFELGGFPTDVDRFWDVVHQEGLLRNQTLAHLLDQRPVKVGEPTAAALPINTNPLGFLLQNVFRANAFVVKIKTSTIGNDALGLYQGKIWRKITPPHTACIVLVELAFAETSITLDEEGGFPGYLETVQSFTGTGMAETLGPNFVGERVRTRQLVGYFT